MPRRIMLAVGALALAAPTAVAVTPVADATTGITFIDFEDQSTAPCYFVDSDGPLRDRYAAAKFRGPTANGGGAVLDNCGGFGVTPHSGVKFLAFNSSLTYTGGGTPTGPERIALPTRPKRVSIWVSQGNASGTATFKLVGKDGKRTVKSTSVSTTTSDWVQLSLARAKGFTSVVLSTPLEPDGAWLADDLMLTN